MKLVRPITIDSNSLIGSNVPEETSCAIYNAATNYYLGGRVYVSTSLYGGRHKIYECVWDTSSAALLGHSPEAYATNVLQISPTRKTLNVGTGHGFAAAQTVRIAYTGKANVYMEGAVVSYAAGVLVVSVTTVVGSGAYSSWAVTSPQYWLDLGPTNAWKMFDKSMTSQTVNPTSIRCLFEATDRSNTIYAGNIDCASASFVMATKGAKFVGSISGNTLTVTSLISGALAPKQAIYGVTESGTQLGDDVRIAAFGTGAGGVGTYTLSWKNLCTYSEQFDNVVWQKVSVTVFANAAVAPNGTTTADNVSNTASVVSWTRQALTLLPNTTYSYSIYAKSVSGTGLIIFEGYNGVVQITASFNLATGAISIGGVGATATILDVGSGWWRLSYTMSVNSLTNWLLPAMFIGGYGSTATPTTISLWGAMAEIGSVATTYQSTTAAYSQTIASQTFVTGTEQYNSTYSMVSDRAVTSWYDYFFEPLVRLTDYVEQDIPLLSNTYLMVTLTDSISASCGAIVIGQSRILGGTQYGAEVGIQDYSVITTDDFGNRTLLERAYNRRGKFKIWVENLQMDDIQNLLAQYRATPALYLGSDEYASTMIYGICKNFNTLIDRPTTSLLDIEVQGLA